MWNRRCPAKFLLLGLLGLPGLAVSANDMQLRGFFAQGYLLSDGNNVNGESSRAGGSFDYRELGVNASWRPSSQLLLSAQVASVRQGAVTKEDLVLDYALADFLAWHEQGGRVGLRAGKLKLPFGFYNEARDTSFSRPSLLLPQSVYLDTDGARAFGYFSGWGGALYGDAFRGRHNLAFDLVGFGESSLKNEASISILRRPASGQFETKGGVVLRISDDIDGGRWRMAVTASEARLRYNPGQRPPFDQAGDFRLRQYFLSLEHNRERLSLTAEVVRRRIQLDNLISNPMFGSSQTDQDSMGFYLQGTYRLRPRWSLLARYDERQRELQDRNGHGQSAATGLPRHYFFSRDFTLGTRFDWTRHWSLWGEFHLIDGVNWVNPLDNPQIFDPARLQAGGAERYWSLLVLMAAYRF